MTADRHRFDIYGFTKIPFGNLPGKPFLNDERTELLNRLNNFLEYRGFAVLTGPVGGGKSSLLNHFCSRLNNKTNLIIYMPFSILNEGDFLRAVCRAMNLEPAASKSRMINTIQAMVKDIQPVNPVLVLDEAQKISTPTLEFIRLLANFEFDGKNLFSVIMIGTNELLSRLRYRILEPLNQRITFFGRIRPLNRDETAEYIKHGFEQVGVCQDIVEEQAFTLVHDLSGGIPRLINSITKAALENAADEESLIIKLQHVRDARQYTLISAQEINHDSKHV